MSRKSQYAIVLRHFDGSIHAWNRTAETMYGYTEAEAQKMNIATLIPDAVRKDEEQFMERLRRGERVKYLKTQRVAKEGRIVNIRLSASILLDNKGNPTAIITTEKMTSK